MAEINGIKPIINLFVTKPGARYVTKPEVVSIFKADLASLRPAFDTFERSTKSITIDEVKKLFPTGKLDENNYVIREMKDVLARIEPKPKKVIDLSSELTEQDYKLITDMMNLHNGKYIDVWKGYSDTDLIPNIEKLALFNRSMRLSKQADDFLQFNPDQWDVVVDGIVKKPKESIVPLLEYKVNSDEINKALSTGEITPAVQKKIDVITNYLNLFETKKDLTVYRGEGGYGILNSVKLISDSNLAIFLEKQALNIEQKKLSQQELQELTNYLSTLLQEVNIIQPRFLSTAMIIKGTDKYAKKIFWKIKIPSGTKGASIESFNVERINEAEFLIQRGSAFNIKKVNYNSKRHLWELDAEIKQNR